MCVTISICLQGYTRPLINNYSVGGYYVGVGHTYLHAWMVQVAYSVVVE